MVYYSKKLLLLCIKFWKTYCGDDEFSGEKTDSRNGTVSKQGNGSERVDNGVDVGKPLEIL